MIEKKNPPLLSVGGSIICRFDSDGRITKCDGELTKEAFSSGNNIFEICDFLYGTVESLVPGDQASLAGIHHVFNGHELIIDAAVLHDDDGSFVLMMRDETSRYQAINQLNQQRNEADIMQHRLSRQNEQLEILKDVAETAVRTRTKFLATVSHEIRTPLNALIGFVELLTEQELTSAQARQVSAIQAAGQSLTGLLNDILDLSKIESGKYQIDNKPFSLLKMLEDTVGLCRKLADSKGLNLSIESGQDIPKQVVGDRMRLSQVVLNLVTNAIKFTDRGHVIVRVKVADSTDTSELVEFEVEDTGRGIANDKQQQIFEEFSQNQAGDANELGGVGLGLAIVKQLVNAMGGDIEVKSEPGRGSNFRIRLPLERVVEGSQKVVRSGIDPAGLDLLNDIYVLLAEDNRLNQQYVREILSARDCKVSVVGSGEAAIQVLKTEPIDVVFMDVLMPEMNGDEAIKEIRENLLFPLNKIPIIVLSGKTGNDEATRLLNLGANEILVKPYQPDALIRALVETLEKSSSTESAEVDNRISNDISAEMIDIYRSETPNYLRDLLLALYAQNERRFNFQAHKMQSAMWVMEYMETYEILARLENEPLSFEQRYALCEQVCRAVENSLRPLK